MKRALQALLALWRTEAGRPHNAPAAAAVSDLGVRREIGDAVLDGQGYEFGAGLLPSRFAKVADLTVIDKRTPEELAALFGQRPDYPVLAFEEAARRPLVDFVTAHHVVEHLPNPIRTLADWIGLLRVGGVVFLSIPSANNPYERLREVTPISHIVLDYMLDADGTDFDSRQHIQSFIQQWTAVSPEHFWFTGDGVQAYAQTALSEQRRVAGHDLHWHTYSRETLVQVVETAFYAAGEGLVWEAIRETEGELYVVARKSGPPRRPDFLAPLAQQFQARLATLA